MWFAKPVVCRNGTSERYWVEFLKFPSKGITPLNYNKTYILFLKYYTYTIKVNSKTYSIIMYCNTFNIKKYIKI